MAIEQEVLNYASDDGGNVSVPRRLRTRPNSSEVELAYITPEEAGILSTLRPGSPHRGPMEVPSYDDYDAKTGSYTTSEVADYGPNPFSGRGAFNPSSVTGQGLLQAGQHPDPSFQNIYNMNQRNLGRHLK